MPEPLIAFTVFGQLISMKNSKIQAVKGGKAFTFKNPAVVKYEKTFAPQVPPEYRNLRLGGLTVPLQATIRVFYPTMRQDLDCALVYDCLQRAGVIADDRHIRVKYEYAYIDKDNPRVEIQLCEERGRYE